MPDLIGSFQQGYSLGSGIVKDMNSQDRLKTLQEREDTQWQQQQEDRKQSLADAATARERGETTWQQQQEDREQSLADAEANRKRAKTLQGREDVQWKQTQETYNHNKTLQNRQEAERLQGEWYNSMQLRGEFVPPPPELTDYYKENPHLDLINTFAPDSYIGRQQAKTLMKQLSMGEMPSSNDPRLINSVTNLFPEITQNQSLPTEYQGKQISKREISGVFPTEDGSGFYVQQKLTLDDGSTVEVPVTEGRSSDPNDVPLAVPFQEATKRMASMDQLDMSFDDDDKQQLFNIRVQQGLAKQNIKDNKDVQKQMLQTLDDINVKEQEALGMAQDDAERQVIQQEYEKLRTRTRNAYQSVLGGQVTPSDRTRTDSANFKSAMAAVDNFTKDQGIKLTPQIKADVEEAYRQGAPLEWILNELATEYGNENSSANAQSVLDEIQNYAGGSSTGSGGSRGGPALNLPNNPMTPEYYRNVRQNPNQPRQQFPDRPLNQPSDVNIDPTTLANIERLERGQ